MLSPPPPPRRSSRLPRFALRDLPRARSLIAVAMFLEDVVLVTADGSENLTASLPRTAEALELMTTRALPKD